jgi:putative transposase
LQRIRAPDHRRPFSPSSVSKWTKRERETGSLAPAQIDGDKPRTLSGDCAEWLRARIGSGPSTLRGLAVELAERGIKTHPRAVWVFVRAEGLSFKKPAARGTDAACRGTRKPPDRSPRRRPRHRGGQNLWPLPRQNPTARLGTFNSLSASLPIPDLSIGLAQSSMLGNGGGALFESWVWLKQRHRGRNKHRDTLLASAPGIDDIRPLLHHMAALNFVLCFVVDTA